MINLTVNTQKENFVTAFPELNGYLCHETYQCAICGLGDIVLVGQFDSDIKQLPISFIDELH